MNSQAPFTRYGFLDPSIPGILGRYASNTDHPIQGVSLSPLTLDPYPIQNTIAPSPRRLSFLLALITYGLLILGIQFAWVRGGREKQNHSLASVATHLIYFEKEPDVPVPQNRDAASGVAGTGTIDPHLQELAPAQPKETPVFNLDMLPTALPQDNLFASMNPALPVAVGGNGLAKGRGDGSGHGNGTGSRHGNGDLGGAKGDGPTLSIADMDVLYQEPTHYPETARAAGVEGVVVLRVTIDEKGVPTDMDVVSGHSLLVPESLRSFKLWRFASVKYHGRAVSAVFTVSILYLLNGS